LTAPRKFEPGIPAFYENHGFSPDGSRLLFSSNLASAGRQSLTTTSSSSI